MFQLQVGTFSFSSLSTSCRQSRFQFKFLNRLSVYDFEIRIDFFYYRSYITFTDRNVLYTARKINVFLHIEHIFGGKTLLIVAE